MPVWCFSRIWVTCSLTWVRTWSVREVMVAVRPLNAPPALPAERDCLEGLCFTRVVPEEVMVAEGGCRE